MFWELTLLNRLYKQNEFCRIKPRMHRDRVIFAHNSGDKFCTVLQKIQKDDKIASETEILEYFGIDYSELGEVIQFYK
jgi:hypothetical protein